MRNWLKNHFIPHEGNDHKPHILRTEAIFAILSFVLVIEMGFAFNALLISRFTGFLAAILPDVLTDETNSNRFENGLKALSNNDILAQAAKMKAEDMAQKGYFAHVSPDGKSPWYWFQEAGYAFSSAGENLAVNFIDSKDVSDAWMASPTHRANILNNTFSEIGIATARGIYKGQEAIFVVQFFGHPAKALAATAPVAPIPQVAQASPATDTIAAPSPNPDVQQSFIELTDVEPAEIIEPTQNAGTSRASFAEKIAATSKETAGFLLMFLATIIGLALVLKIFIKIKIQHPPLLVNGAAMLLIIATALWLNEFVSVLGASVI